MLFKKIDAKITEANLIKEAEQKPLTIDEQLEKVLDKPAQEEKKDQEQE